MAIMKCPDMKQLTPVCTKISVPDIERNCRKEIENLSNRFVETRGGRCSGAHPTYFPEQWDHCLCKHSLHFKQKLRWTVDLTHSARFPCPFWKKKKGSGRSLCYLWVHLEGLQGQGHGSSSYGCLPHFISGSWKLFTDNFFWTSLPGITEEQHNKVMQKARGGKREELWGRVGFSPSSVPDLCNVAICRLSWCYFLWWYFLHSLFSTTSKVFSLGFKTLASCSHCLPLIRLPEIRQIITFLWASSVCPGHTESGSRGSQWPPLCSVAPLIFIKLWRRKPH